MPPTQSQLTDAIADAVRKAVTKLFSEHPGRFYYCSLVTTGEAHAPQLSAWSEEALREAARSEHDPDSALEELKWSYADSPFCGYGEEHFAEVLQLFAERPRMDPDDLKAWEAEWQSRVDAMEAALSLLDGEGLFGRGAARSQIVINVEVAPPDSTNTERAVRLNPPEAVRTWLSEAAEGPVGP